MSAKVKEMPNLIGGSITKSLIALSLPIVASNLLQTCYQLTDTFWVGRLGAEAVAAVALSFPLIFLMLSVGIGLSIAGTVLLAQYKGQNNQKMVDLVAAQTLVMLVLVSIVLAVIGYFSAGPVLNLMGAEGNLLSLATQYLKISYMGLVFLFTYFVSQSLMRGVGDVKTPMYVVGFTVVLNFFLDPLFIMGFGSFEGYGVVGAAMATFITQGLAAIIGLVILFSGKYGIKLKLPNLKIDLGLMKKMFFIGLPASIEQSAVAIGFTLMTVVAALFGTEVVAAYGIGGRILSFIIIPAVGLAMATSTLVGQNIGAGKVDRAEKITILSSKIGFYVLTLVGIILLFTARPVVSAFIPGDLEVINHATLFVQIIAMSFGFVGVQQTINGAFAGSGNTMMSMSVTLISLWIFQFPIAFILSNYTSLKQIGIWIAFPVSYVLGAAMALALFYRGTWKNKKLIDRSPTEKLQDETRDEVKIEEGFESV
jgi:putative MATE family efflux protein